MSRLSKEQETIEKMIGIYCQGKGHLGARPQASKKDKLCPECQLLADYASQRLKYCQFGEEKPVCGNCTVHCYKPDMRSKIKEVMRYAGPKMIYKHPAAAISHLIQKRKK